MANEPALFKHCVNLYDAMMKEAEYVDGDTYLWKGALTKFSTPIVGDGYYSAVVGTLKKMECIHRKRRGTGGIPSEWYLQKRPTLDDFYAAGPGRSRNTELEQQISDLNKRIADLEKELSFVRKGIAVEYGELRDQ